MAYLERYASSAEKLRRVLIRKVATAAACGERIAAAFRDAIDEVVAKSLRIGLVDDARYAEGRVASLRRRGGSARAIRAKLSIKGVDGATIAAALEAGDDDEETAALAFARRRKLGPYRPGDRAPYRGKDLAALGRAGFGFGIARRIVDAEREDDD